MSNGPENSTSGSSESRCQHCGQPLPKSAEWKRRRFTLGIILAASTFIPFGISIGAAVDAISASKTTGLGAVAGGFSELYATIGAAAIVLFAVVAIVLLVRGFSTEEPLRVIGSILGIAWCGFILVSTVFSVGLMIFLQRQLSPR